MASNSVLSFLGNQTHADQAQRWMISLASSFRVQLIPYYLLSGFLLAFAYHFLLVTRGPNEPPLVRGIIPFLGVAPSFLINPEPFLLDCQKRYGDIFTIYVAGRRMHIIADPINAIPAVYRNFKTFTFQILSNSFDIVLFGVSERQAKDTALYNENLSVIAPNLLSQTAVEALIKNFNKHLQSVLSREVRALDIDEQLSKDGVVIDLIPWLRKIMFETSGKALFGETWPSDNSFLDDFVEFENGMYNILKRYPSFLTRKAINARERYYHRLLEMFQKPLVHPGKLIPERFKVLSSLIGIDKYIETKHGYSLPETVRNMIGVVFALQANAIPASFWLVAFVSCLPEVEKAEVLHQVDSYSIPEESNRQSTSFDVPGLLRDPLLNAALSETLRLQAPGLSPRAVTQDTAVTVNGRAYNLQKESVLFVATSLVHKDPRIYESPEEYKLKRFLKWHTKSDKDENKDNIHFFKNGVPIRHPLIPWGGGHFMCSGRKFATGEILLFAASILHQFEILPVDGNGSLPLPAPPSVSRYGGGAEFPGRPWLVRIKYRQT